MCTHAPLHSAQIHPYTQHTHTLTIRGTLTHYTHTCTRIKTWTRARARAHRKRHMHAEEGRARERERERGRARESARARERERERARARERERGTSGSWGKTRRWKQARPDALPEAPLGRLGCLLIHKHVMCERVCVLLSPVCAITREGQRSTCFISRSCPIAGCYRAAAAR